MFAYSTFTGMWVQAIGLFAQATCAPECWLLRLFNQRLLVLHVGGAAVEQQKKSSKQIISEIKIKNKKKIKKIIIKKVQKKKKKAFDWLCFQDIHVTSLHHSGKFVLLERSELSRVGCWINGLSYLKKRGGWIKIRRLFPN